MEAYEPDPGGHPVYFRGLPESKEAAARAVAFFQTVSAGAKRGRAEARDGTKRQCRRREGKDKWYARADSNGRPSAPEADALSS